MKITIIAGARPNFMKIAPIIHAIEKSKQKGSDISYRLVHTGQHYDKMMSATFFEELNIPEPNNNLNCGGGSQAEQTAAILIAFEKELTTHPADLVLVVGDVTSSMACAIVAKKMCVKVAHIEAGIRSFDLTMPEEINRIVTDSITDYFFTTSKTANHNLYRAGIDKNVVFYVGNVMIDTLLTNMNRFKRPSLFDVYELEVNNYFILTLHRPANVDRIDKLREIIIEITNNTQNLPIIFPIHPRTAKLLKDIDIKNANLIVAKPMGYLEFNYLVKHSKAVITDSGGITEETTVMKIPCLTLRDNTERPETITEGTNELVGTNPQNIKPVLEKLFLGKWKQGGIPELWDGKAAERIVNVISNLWEEKKY